MPQTLEALARHTQTLTSIRGIVHTMKTMSAINAVPYDHAAQSVQSYHQTILSGIKAFVANTGTFVLPIVPKAVKILVVFGSDHGLCGNYNEELALTVRTEASPGKSNADLICVGARMSAALKNQALYPVATLLPPASADGIGRLAINIVNLLDEMGGSAEQNRMSVKLIFTQRSSNGLREPIVRQLLPLEPSLLSAHNSLIWQSRSRPVYTMQATALLAALLRNHIFASIFQASAEAMVTENEARLSLMQQAEKAVEERLEEVGKQFRLARQDEITNELMDIIIGFEALQK